MYKKRFERVLAKMEERGLEQILVMDPNSIWYLTVIRTTLWRDFTLFISAPAATT